MGLFDIFKRSAPKTPSAPITPAVAESAQAAATGAAGAAAATAAAAVASAAPPEATAAAAVPAVPAVEVADADVESVVAEELAGFSGGLSGLLDKVKEGGLGDIADSWVSKGQNLGISADQVKSLMDPERLKGIAEKLGISVDMAADKLAAVLPGVIDKLTPDGVVPDPDAIAAKLTGFIKTKL